MQGIKSNLQVILFIYSNITVDSWLQYKFLHGPLYNMEYVQNKCITSYHSSGDGLLNIIAAAVVITII